MIAYDTTAKAIEDALAANSVTRKAVIDVTNERGIITLSGEVEELDIALAAADIAAKQNGVIKVVNDLAVEGEQEKLEEIRSPSDPRLINR